MSVARSTAEAVAAREVILVACSPTLDALRALFDPLVDEGRLGGKHLVCIVDAGVATARYLDEVLHERGGAASVVNVALFGTMYNVLHLGGAVLNASGRLRSREAWEAAIAPLLRHFGDVAWHDAGARTAALFAWAGHLAFLPAAYALMHFQALIARGGVDGATALAYFQATNRAVIDVYAPLLARAFDARDHSMFFFSHETARHICTEAAETCRELGVDDGLARLLAGYHERAGASGAPANFTAAYEVIAPVASLTR